MGSAVIHRATPCCSPRVIEFHFDLDGKGGGVRDGTLLAAIEEEGVVWMVGNEMEAMAKLKEFMVDDNLATTLSQCTAQADCFGWAMVFTLNQAALATPGRPEMSTLRSATDMVATK